MASISCFVVAERTVSAQCDVPGAVCWNQTYEPSGSACSNGHLVQCYKTEIQQTGQCSTQEACPLNPGIDSCVWDYDAEVSPCDEPPCCDDDDCQASGCSGQEPSCPAGCRPEECNGHDDDGDGVVDNDDSCGDDDDGDGGDDGGVDDPPPLPPDDDCPENQPECDCSDESANTNLTSGVMAERTHEG